MNRGYFRGIGMNPLIPYAPGTNPQTVTGDTKTIVQPTTNVTDGNVLRRSTGAGAGVIWSQDYIFVGTSVARLLLPAGVWDVLLIGGGAGGGGTVAAVGTVGLSGGGGSATSQILRTRIIADGATPYAITIGQGGTGVSGAIGNGGSSTTVLGVVLASGLIPATPGSLSASGGSAGFACSGTGPVTGWGGIPAYPTIAGQAVTTAPFGYVFMGSGGSLATAGVPNSSITGLAGKPNAYGCTGGGAGATTDNISQGGNGGAAGGIMSGGTAGSGLTGSATGGQGGNAGANTGSGGGGSGGNFTGGAAVTGGNGGSGWVEFFRRA